MHLCTQKHTHTHTQHSYSELKGSGVKFGPKHLCIELDGRRATVSCFIKCKNTIDCFRISVFKKHVLSDMKKKRDDVSNEAGLIAFVCFKWIGNILLSFFCCCLSGGGNCYPRKIFARHFSLCCTVSVGEQSGKSSSLFFFLELQ